jgi:iron(III) transport system substrate-binding protein
MQARSTQTSSLRRRLPWTLLVILAMLIAACGETAGEGLADADADPEPDDALVNELDDLDLDTLIERAQEEGEVVALSFSGGIEDAAESFEEKYGITAHGTKLDNIEITQRVQREVQAGAVQTDVVHTPDAPVLTQEAFVEGWAFSYVPPELRDVIPAEYQDPLVTMHVARPFLYNYGAHPDGCPVSNIWELTEPEWQGKLAITDPMTRPATTDFFSAVSDNADLVEQAYEDHYGEPLETDQPDAGWEWVRRIAEIDPITTPSDGDAGDAVGAPGQSDPPVGLVNYTKLRDNEPDDAGLQLAVCEEMEPFWGFADPVLAAVVADSPNPHAARLFIHPLMAEEGADPWTGSRLGGYSTNPDLPVHEDHHFDTWAEWEEVLVVYDQDINEQAFQERTTWTDLWITYLP